MPAAAKSTTISYGRIASHAAAHAKAMTVRLSAKSRWTDEDIHQIRVLCKKLRAFVHLGRGLVPEKQLKYWNQQLRDAARSLTGAREATILGGWMDAAAANAEPGLARRIGVLRGQLASQFPRRLPTGAKATVLQTLHNVANDWPNDWGKIARGPEAALRRMRRKASAAGKRALHGGDIEDWHDWRRRVKYEAYQLEWIALARDRKPAHRYRNLRQLGSALGKFNDMHNLIAWLDATGSRSQAAVFLKLWATEAGKAWGRKAKSAARKVL